MSGTMLDRVRSDALELSESERAEFAHDLVLSLDGSANPRSAELWDAEIVRRVDDVEAGTANLIEREEFKRRMQKRLRGL